MAKFMDMLEQGFRKATPTGMAYDYFFGSPADEVKAAYDQGMGYAQDSGGRIKDFLLGQQQQALGYYKPVQNMFNSAYGTQGLMPMQRPGGR